MEDIISKIKSVEEEAERKLKEAIEKKDKELSFIKQEMEKKITNSEKKFKQDEEQRYKIAIENYKKELAEIIKYKKEKANAKIKAAEKNIGKTVEFIVEQIKQSQK